VKNIASFRSVVNQWLAAHRPYWQELSAFLAFESPELVYRPMAEAVERFLVAWHFLSVPPLPHPALADGTANCRQLVVLLLELSLTDPNWQQDLTAAQAAGLFAARVSQV
jgi:hypothetical protein